MKYVGSKSRISKYIVPIIQSYINETKSNLYIEPFVGGANVIDKIWCKKKIGYDKNKYLIELLKMARDNPSGMPNTIDKETYYFVKERPEKYYDWFVGLVGLCASYNGKWFGGYANGVKTKAGTVRNYTDESIKNIKKQSENLKGALFYCADFNDIKVEEPGSVIYCDPPYKGTTKYGKESFQYDVFYNWCREKAENNVVIVSEYCMPEDFKCVWESDVTCTLDKGSRTKRKEKLFIARR